MSTSCSRITLLGERLRATKVGESRSQLAGDEVERGDGWGNQTVEIRWHTLDGELVEQASSLWPWSGNESAVLDGVEVDEVEATVSSRTPKRTEYSRCWARISAVTSSLE